MVEFPEKFVQGRKNVCIQGLGFVGSAMALAVASANNSAGEPLYNVIGIDVPTEGGNKKAASLNAGVFPFESSDQNLAAAMKKAHQAGNLFATTDAEYFAYADIVVVDINLDVYYDANEDPLLKLDMFRSAMHTVGSKIKAGTLIIVETTVPPGTCEKVVCPIIKEEFQKRGLHEDDFYVAHSYERVMPGEHYFDSIVNYWRVYSGINEESADRCEAFLKSVISTEQYPLTRLEKTSATEIAKVLENSYRATTIAFMEEWGRFAEAIGVNLYEVIDAIRMRPTHSNMRQPGFGVGGYCLTKDPYFAKLAAKDLFGLDGMDFPFCTMAVKTNKKMPLVSLDKIQDFFEGDLKDKKMLILGISYRQDVGDTRYSPSQTFFEAARARGASVECQDPLVKHWDEENMDVMNDIPDLDEYDVLVFTVPHAQYKKIDFSLCSLKRGALIFDANAVLTGEQYRSVKTRTDVEIRSIGR